MLYIPSYSHLPVLLFLMVVFTRILWSLSWLALHSLHKAISYTFMALTTTPQGEPTRPWHPRSTKESETFLYSYTGSLTVCEYQASGDNHFQFGHKWKVNLPIKNKNETEKILYSHSTQYCSVLLSSSPLKLNTEQHPRAKERENYQVGGGEADQAYVKRRNSRVK